MYRKVIKRVKHIKSESSYAFEQELRKSINQYQEEGLEVDVAHGGTEKSFSAIVTAYEMVAIVPSN